jgi:hypothetical protein
MNGVNVRGIHAKRLMRRPQLPLQLLQKMLRHRQRPQLL